ncbi:unnamed protein product [Macrosiphum euphorbiae]|uniref:Uncharacterized protein n=1 Tax=Macrosiphum euphorbiae TaxID=13131 RepID=A0AAV0XVP0_9HEMI|nr:unnamed protein product [Macrosiphum euphorbiae]CAI6372019.1 unnamed protein product [Macrosiphum euphorbiae]
MKILYDIAVTLQTDKTVVPIFLARNRDVKNYVIDLNLETDIILDQLIVLNSDSENETQHVSIKKTFMEQYYIIIAINSTLGLDDRANARPAPSSSQCQLPKIQLPIFDFDLIQWRSYRDTFSSLVHESPNLPQVDKFHYLISSVTGSAASCVHGLPITVASIKALGMDDFEGFLLFYVASRVLDPTTKRCNHSDH